ncbi:MAG: adenylate kinase [Hominenteromicrobium sp.]
MILLICGSSHTGKTALAQRLLEKYKYPYLSIDHLKMGLIRSGYTTLTPEDDAELVPYLWPVLREMIKTAIENKQNLIVEGAYIPFDWKESFEPEYLAQIRYTCLIMSERYIRAHFDDILRFESVIEDRITDPDFTPDAVIADNRMYLEQCQAHGLDYILIDKQYAADIAL